MSASFETIRLEVAERVATLTLNRPERLNSFNEQMHQEVRAALAEVQAGRTAGEVRALRLTGAGRGFCAGQDLSDRAVAAADEAPDLGASIERNYKPLVTTLRALELPVICAVNGVAAGAGANVALACDMVLAGRSASFIQSFSRIGLVPDAGGTWILPRLVGRARAMGLALLGEKLSAEQAAQWGLIWKVVEDDVLLSEAIELAKQLAEGPTKGFGLIKKAMHASSGNSLDAQLELERDLQREAGYSEDYREGVTAFKEKRPPRFKGK